ncbi:putative glycoside hydrolase [Cellulosilyticum sp. I15G10I2]|uniref:putative glycoside hydrolase n=1 Tax=Cellulosilyticum sp. I15G10I2 TaxID=1892843 RepID=UPI00085BDDB7|nr:putative glycoside hydrolase [Cellulosilyticum sp. I15G10I2]
MKKYKIRPTNSYYYYKKKKNMKVKFLILAVVLVCIAITFILSGKMSETISEISKVTFAKAEENGEITENFYFDGTDIKYDLYRSPKIVKGIYIPASRVNQYEEYISLVNNTSVNAFIIDVKNDKGYLTFNSTNPKLIEMGCVLENPPIKDMRFIMNRLYEEDIYPIARIVAFKDSVAAPKFPDRAVKDKTGNTYTNKASETWLNPYDKRNWEYLLQICEEAIQMGFKEIQFDYVRFHESMNEQTVILSENISKTEIITAFVKYMYEHLSAYGVYVSADVFGAIITSKIDSDIVGQDFKELSKHLDYICPMVYPSHYAKGTFGIEYPHLDAYGIILRSMEFAQDEIKKIPREERRAIIRPWLQDFTMSSSKPYLVYGKEQIEQQIKGAYDAGLSEWIFWNAAGKYTQTGLEDK